MESRTKLSTLQARALELFLKTLDRFDLMGPYLITVEMKPGTSLDRYSDIVYDQPQKVYGIVIRIIGNKNYTLRITLSGDEI